MSLLYIFNCTECLDKQNLVWEHLKNRVKDKKSLVIVN